MNINALKHELQDVLSGKNQVRDGAFIQTIALYLGGGQEASRMAQKKQYDKSEETRKLITYVDKHDYWVRDIQFSQFISAGAEQRVYVQNDKYVLKLNDSIYYAYWIDYFYSLLLNNFFFTDTAYCLLGFHYENDILYAVVKQPFVKATEPTNVQEVKAFIENNGLKNIRNHDYYHPKLGVILEDLHDENVLTQHGILYFIDTVFFIKPEIFWQ